MADDPTPAIRLEISEQDMRFTCVAGDDVEITLGTRRMGAGGFRRNPPAEIEIEEAIAVVEDALMPVLQKLPSPAVWRTRDEAARELAINALGFTPPGVATIDDVERLFNAMARASALGSWAGAVPLDARQAAYLLILRECLHHAGVRAIRIE
ncbi:hypothetical protein QTH91_04995 [Variovorax dokdonensis]|uniref:Uncharacterized protein n=1 Tax=Variovorax dokdonensis TaxID=344883 RepID=A0ABT7N7D0_9BURK|nr:hypothetical protein [Variovorax dokdonensis]MDM0043833.1 hypothetical protein [Variovorax dokdonensis]